MVLTDDSTLNPLQHGKTLHKSAEYLEKQACLRLLFIYWRGPERNRLDESGLAGVEWRGGDRTGRDWIGRRGEERTGREWIGP